MNDYMSFGIANLKQPKSIDVNVSF